MSASPARIPGYRIICTIIGAIYVLLATSMLVRGARTAMTPFQVPEETLASPHFADFFHFTFVHMAVLGVVIVLLGRLVDGIKNQRAVAIVMSLVQAHYTYLDLRTSDSPLGNALYRGSATLVPPAVDVVVLGLFLYLTVRSFTARAATAPG